MALQVNKLNARSVAAMSEPGRYSDGAGLYLLVDRRGSSPDGDEPVRRSKRWIFLFRRDGKLREMSLGKVSDVSLQRARELAGEARALVRAGRNPIEERSALPVAVPTFGEAADAYIEAMRPQFRNEKHVAQWEMTLRDYAKALRPKRVDTISTDDVLAVLKPLWSTKPETASRLRGRIERVLDAAKAQGHRAGENPAAWRGHLANLLPKRKKLSRGHHAALPYAEVPAFVARLRALQAGAARALEFAILTAARSGEIREATWREIDLANKVWVVPANRMKAGREHRVPLSAPACAMLERFAAMGFDRDGFVFPGRRGQPLSATAMDMLLRRMKADVTVHGFRSSFRDWTGEETDFPREVAEAALAHVVGDQTERAYRRGDALAKRRELMNAWAAFVDAPAVPSGG